MRATLSRYLMYFQTILVQDSDVQRRTQIRYTLSLKGYKVLEAGSPKDAEIICAMKEVSIDLVIRETETPDNFHWPMAPASPHDRVGSVLRRARSRFSRGLLASSFQPGLPASPRSVCTGASAAEPTRRRPSLAAAEVQSL